MKLPSLSNSISSLILCSQSLSTLTVIEEFLAKRPIPDTRGSSLNQNWVRNVNYYRKWPGSYSDHCCHGVVMQTHGYTLQSALRVVILGLVQAKVSIAI